MLILKKILDNFAEAADDKVKEKDSKQENEKCEPGKVFEKDCNTCTCLPKGVPICTLKACPKKT